MFYINFIVNFDSYGKRPHDGTNDIDDINDDDIKSKKLKTESTVTQTQAVSHKDDNDNDNIYNEVEDSRYVTQTYKFSLDNLNEAYNDLIDNRSRLLDIS
ncbi:kinase-like domain-containing protein [Rhizophagus clarus]|uniref:Kinase-like domain-containing protein n=1 Tax=Rhizophagus clarus TaxID=94130 RepID=A0A8H3QEL0_9GLOM|nr:kinase-like domain-containing protein [Rhizophagus clarus]